LKGIESTDSSESDVNKKEMSLQKKMAEFYIKYGHESIGDCGSPTIFIEGISIIAAKAIQDTPLYRGQESSTRYINFANQFEQVRTLMEQAGGVSYHENKVAIDDLLQSYVTFYENTFKKMRVHRSSEMGVDYESSDGITKRAINAWAFDVGRAFLPAATTTQLSFHGSLRDLRNQFLRLKKHALLEVSLISQEVLRELANRYPHSFKDGDWVTSDADKQSMIESYPSLRFIESNFNIENNEISFNGDGLFAKSYNPQKGDEFDTPNLSLAYGTLTVKSDIYSGLDYGSWRDLQRHRNGFCAATIPYISNSSALSHLNMESWYMNNVYRYQDLILEWKELEKKILLVVNKLKKDGDDCLSSYFLPLGLIVPVVVSYSLQEWDYIFNLRLRDTVHPSLVKYLSRLVFHMKDIVPYYHVKYGSKILNELKAHVDGESFGTRRGEQTIISGGKAISDD
jgi:thymidylate synthase ThyX